jgi:Na+/H+ antiporter NhaD/arsenite permease-like protein
LKGRLFVDDWMLWLTLAWFVLTYTGLALGKLPWLRTDRTGVALIGATLVLVTGLLTPVGGGLEAGFDEAVKAVDFRTIALLLGMMVVVGYLREAGFFARLAGWVGAHFHRPFALLAVVIGVSGVLSALLVNDVVCLALAPLVLHLTRRLRLDPRPQLIGLALASNIGSTATPTGNPQNVIIGNLSHISYLRFAERLTPVAALGLVVAFFLTAWLYRAALRAPNEGKNGTGVLPTPTKTASEIVNSKRNLLLVKSLVVTLAAVVLFFAGAPMHLVALGAAAVLLLDRVKPEKIYRHIDWGLLLMFAGLFVVVQAFELHVVERWQLAEQPLLREHPVDLLSLASAALSNVVSNVPAVLLFKPVIPALPAEVQETAWLALAMSSTLAGNLTVLGSVANLIVVEQARREGVTISFRDYCWVGVPVTLATLALGIAWLRFVPY